MPQCVTESRFRYQNYRCGHCVACDQTYINSWVLRMQLEALDYPKGQVTFLTLTYEDAKLPKDEDGAREDWQKFMKRIRKRLDFPLRYVASLERGNVHGRLHWHAILYGLEYRREVSSWIASVWSNGFIRWLPANVHRMRYVLKYVMKSRHTARLARKGLKQPGSSQQAGALKGLFLMSRRPALGSRRIPDIQKVLNSLSDKSVRSVRGLLSVDTSPWKSKPVPALSIGGVRHPLHRYLKDRLRVRPTFIPETSIQKLGGSINNEKEEEV